MPSPAPTTGMLRLTRAGALTSVTVGLALAAHVAAGESAPSLVGLLLAAAPVLALALLVTGRRLTLPAVGALLAATQVGLHTAFMALCADGVAASTVTTGRHEHLVATATASTGPAGGARAPLDLVELALLGASPAMTAGHVVAAALVALLAARGEDALWSLWSWLRPALPAAPRLTPSTPPAPTGRVAVLHPTQRWAQARPRGPPRRLAPTAPACS